MHVTMGLFKVNETIIEESMDVNYIFYWIDLVYYIE
jgi:hypothetical protein